MNASYVNEKDLSAKDIDILSVALEKSVNEAVSATILSAEYKERVRLLAMSLSKKLGKDLLSGAKSIYDLAKLPLKAFTY